MTTNPSPSPLGIFTTFCEEVQDLLVQGDPEVDPGMFVVREPAEEGDVIWFHLCSLEITLAQAQVLARTMAALELEELKFDASDLDFLTR